MAVGEAAEVEGVVGEVVAVMGREVENLENTSPVITMVVIMVEGVIVIAAITITAVEASVVVV